MLPSRSMIALSTTSPCTRATLASGGYAGSIFRISIPLVTPCETRIRCGMTGCSLGTTFKLEVALTIPPITPPNCPPGIPPGTPPTTPPPPIGGGASSSLIICTFCGIFEGVRSPPLESNSLSICFMIRLAACAGGGGGGGGGGATRKVNNCDFGSSCVKYSGRRIRTPITRHCKVNENSVVQVCLPFCPSYPSRQSENKGRTGASVINRRCISSADAACSRISGLLVASRSPASSMAFMAAPFARPLRNAHHHGEASLDLLHPDHPAASEQCT